jgi:small nuclear ribonucleoprotein (snRNP)-like protein
MRHLFRQRLRKQVIVTLKDGQSFAGILFGVDKELLVLRRAEALGPAAGERTPVDGEVLILREELAFLQVP